MHREATKAKHIYPLQNSIMKETVEDSTEHTLIKKGKYSKLGCTECKRRKIKVCNSYQHQFKRKPCLISPPPNLSIISVTNPTYYSANYLCYSAMKRNHLAGIVKECKNNVSIYHHTGKPTNSGGGDPKIQMAELISGMVQGKLMQMRMHMDMDML